MRYEKALPMYFLQDLSLAVGLKTGFLILKKFVSSPISRMSQFQGVCSQGNSRCNQWPGKPSPCRKCSGEEGSEALSLLRLAAEDPFARN